jgi:hypothetical protein
LTIIDGLFLWKLFVNDAHLVSKYKKEIRKLVYQDAYAEDDNNLNDQNRIFMSGSPVFWFGSASGQNFLDPQLNRDISQSDHTDIVPLRMRSAKTSSASPLSIMIGLLQVRGGKDQVSTHPTWAMGAYQIREGKDRELLGDWLKIFGVSYILVHDQTSAEYFKDFRNLERFDDLALVGSEGGNLLYKYPASLARTADESLLQVPRPEAGNDEYATHEYAERLSRPLNVKYMTPTEIEISTGELNPSEIISMAVTYDPGWKLVKGQGKLARDNFGNLAIIPQAGVSTFSLEYKEIWTGWFWGVLLSLISCWLLFQSEWLVLKLKFPSLTISQDQEQEEY